MAEVNLSIIMNEATMSEWLKTDPDLKKELQRKADHIAELAKDSIAQNSSSAYGQGPAGIEHAKEYFSGNIESRVETKNLRERMFGVVDSKGWNSMAYEAEHQNLKSALDNSEGS